MTVATPKSLEIPAAALVLRGEKNLVGVISDGGRVDLREVQVVQNDGQSMRITGDLHEGDQVGLDLGNRVPSGAKVQVASEQPQTGAPARAPGSKEAH
jgi:hypothetical protein